MYESKNEANIETGAEVRRRSPVAAIVALFLLIYIPLTFNWFSGKPTPTDILREGSLYEALRTEALVVRDEDPLYSVADGVSISTVNEGDRVPGRSVVATIYSKDSLDLLNDLKNINREILKEQYEVLESSNVFLQEVNGINNEITAEIRKMIPEINRNSLREAALRIGAVNGLTLKKAEAYSALETDDQYVNMLKAEKRRIEEEVETASSAVYCESPGHLSFAPDGYENELTPEGIAHMTVARFDAMIGAADFGNPDTEPGMYGGVPVKGGEPFAKIVKNNSFYLVIKAPAVYSEIFAAGDRVRVRTESPYHEFANAEITSIAAEDTAADDVTAADASADYGGAYERHCLIAFKLTKYLYDYINIRKVNFALVEKQAEGLKIPLKCLRNFDEADDSAEVALLKGAHASIRKVRILASNEIYAIIESYDNAVPECRINRYDTYIREIENIENGMAINK